MSAVEEAALTAGAGLVLALLILAPIILVAHVATKNDWSGTAYFSLLILYAFLVGFGLAYIEIRWGEVVLW